jgi:hypothetical protein
MHSDASLVLLWIPLLACADTSNSHRVLRPLAVILAVILDLLLAVLPHIVSRTRLALPEVPITHLRVLVKVGDGQLGFALKTNFGSHDIS